MIINKDYKQFTLFNFGVIIVPKSNTKLLNNIRLLRKDNNAGFNTNNHVVFVNAPTWFNQYITNIGGVK